MTARHFPSELPPEDVRLECKATMSEVREMGERQIAAMDRIYAMLDMRVGQLIGLLDQRLNTPSTLLNRLVIFITIATVGVLFMAYAHEHGSDAAEKAIKIIPKVSMSGN